MKRFCLLGFSLLLGVLLHAKNKISMVTYFPVPYVAYSQVNTEQMDIGLTDACNMKLGYAGSPATIKAAQVNLGSGRLDLDGGRGILGNTLELGSSITSSVGSIRFKNVRFQTGNMESVNAESVNVETLYLFDKSFPSCRAVNTNGTGLMRWEKLELAGAVGKELYLMCGDFETAACAPTHNGMEVYTGECPSGQKGSITYTWDYTVCRYNDDVSCEGCTWQYERWRDYPYDAVRDGTPQNAIYCPDGSDVEKYIRWTKGEMTRAEYLRWVCSPVVPNLGGEQVWIAADTFQHCESVNNPPVPTSEKDLCIMESSFCNAYPEQREGCPYRSVSLFRAVCK